MMIIIPIKWLFHWEYTIFSDKPIYREVRSQLMDFTTIVTPISLFHPWPAPTEAVKGHVFF